MELAYHLQQRPRLHKHIPTSSRPTACTACRDAHTACDLSRPCARCTRLGKPHLCCDAPPRKRARAISGATAGGKRQAKEPSTSRLQTTVTPQPGDMWNTTTTTQQPQPQPHHSFAAVDSDGGGGEHQQRHLHYTQPPPPPPLPQKYQQHRPATVAAFYQELYAQQQQQQQPEDSKATITKQQPLPAPVPTTAATATTTTTPTPTTTTNGGTQGLEERVDRLGRLVATLHADVARLERSNAELVDKVARLEDALRRANGGSGNNNNNHNNSAGNGHVASSPAVGAATTPLGELLTTSPSTSSAPSSSPLPGYQPQHLLLEAGVPPALAMEARQNLPWLCHYHLPTRFAITSFSMYPVCVMEQRYTWELPTVLAYANPAFAELCQYPMDELIGAYYTKLFSLPPKVECYSSVLYNQRPMAVSELIGFGLLLRRKDGVILRMRDQSQIFYNNVGMAQYVVMSFHGWQAGQPDPDEVFGHWVPLLNPLDSPSQFPPYPPSSSSSSANSQSPTATSSAVAQLRSRAAPSPLSSSSPSPSNLRFAPVVESWSSSSSPADLAESAFELLDQLSWPSTPTATSSSTSSSSSSSSVYSAHLPSSASSNTPQPLSGPPSSGFTFFGADRY